MLNEIIVHEKDILNNKRNNEKIRPFSSILSQQGTLNLLLKKIIFQFKRYVLLKLFILPQSIYTVRPEQTTFLSTALAKELIGVGKGIRIWSA